jgi:hypothetical protein
MINRLSSIPISKVHSSWFDSDHKELKGATSAPNMALKGGGILTGLCSRFGVGSGHSLKAPE